MKRLVLFPDTNLFIQCKALEEIDWPLITEADEIVLVMSKPVLREIDRHKSGGNTRRADRARKAITRLRPLLTTPQDELIVTLGKGPVLKIVHRGDLLPAPDLKEKLDFNATDDALVATVHAYRLENPEVEARALSHDGGVLGTAKALGIPAVLIPDEWLLPPETDEATKKLNEKDAELRRLKSTFPAFEHSLHDVSGGKIDVIRIQQAHFDPLSDVEVRALLDRLKQRFPLVTDFSERPPTPRQPGVWQQQFNPPTKDAIQKYSGAHAKWLSSCHYKLKYIHLALEHARPTPTFAFHIKNAGIVPAKDALITLAAKGDFFLKPPAYRGDDEPEGTRTHEPVLPAPPQPPEGEWKVLSAIPSVMDIVATDRGPFARYGLEPLTPANIPTGSGKEDPNAFYYKGGRAEDPVEAFQLRCAQWRHGHSEDFVFEIYSEMREGRIDGAIDLKVECANLPESYERTVPVRIVRASTSTLQEAKGLVEKL